MPAVDPGTIDWRLWDDDGTLNTGLVVFFVLSAACVGVWAAGVASYLSYARAVRRLPRCCPAARQFVVSRKDSDLLAPLMPEGPLKKHTGGAGGEQGGPATCRAMQCSAAVRSCWRGTGARPGYSATRLPNSRAHPCLQAWSLLWSTRRRTSSWATSP